LLRAGKDAPFDVKITRDTITVASVTYDEVEKGIWHLSVNQFSDGTKMEFNKAINAIKLKNPKGIILDLRWDGGGYLTGAVDVLSAFFKGEKQVVSIEYKDPKQNEKLKTDGSAAFPDLPLVVLVNKGSASASEIVAAAIQDLKRGVIMGTVSYGKGTVQEVDPLPDGSSLRYTIAKWNAPTGRNINGTGITPDILVEPKDEDLANKFDRQLDEAVKYLRNK
jgi:carboxyl-terminal processing protease